MLEVPQLQQTHMLKAELVGGSVWEGVWFWVWESKVSDGWSRRLFGLAFRVVCQMDGGWREKISWISRLRVGFYEIRTLRARVG